MASSSVLWRDIEDLVRALDVLASDVQHAAALSEWRDTQFSRRAYVRAAFALIEGNLNLMAGLIDRARERGEIQLTKGEGELLRQERREATEEGIEIVRVKFVPISDRLTPVLGLFGRLFGQVFAADKSDRGWAAFREALGLRNRITHPKTAECFNVSGQEIATVEEARSWFASEVERLLESCFNEAN